MATVKVTDIIDRASRIIQDTSNVKAGYLGILDAFADTGIERPIALSATIEPITISVSGGP